MCGNPQFRHLISDIHFTEYQYSDALDGDSTVRALHMACNLLSIFDCPQLPVGCTQIKMENRLMKVGLIAGLAMVSLSGCGQSGSSNDLTQKRLKVCEEVMRRYIVESKLAERDWKKTVGSCNISQLHRSLEQWECVLKGMENGQKYVEAADRCGATPDPN